jgi:hypothetical protein
MSAAKKKRTHKTPVAGSLPTNLEFEKALMFFHSYMYGPLQGKLRLYKARGIPPAVVALSADWEVFASILVNDIGRKIGAGIDLANFEVKSAKNGGSYEYQYHKDAGKEKLTKDMKVGHLFFDYYKNLEEVDLRYVHGSKMKKEFFEPWLKNFPNPYPQRYRKAIPFGWVKNNGKLLMSLRQGEVAYPELANATPKATIEADKNNKQTALSVKAKAKAKRGSGVLE